MGPNATEWPAPSDETDDVDAPRIRAPTTLAAGRSRDGGRDRNFVCGFGTASGSSWEWTWDFRRLLLSFIAESLVPTCVFPLRCPIDSTSVAWPLSLLHRLLLSFAGLILKGAVDLVESLESGAEGNTSGKRNEGGGCDPRESSDSGGNPGQSSVVAEGGMLSRKAVINDSCGGLNSDSEFGISLKAGGCSSGSEEVAGVTGHFDSGWGIRAVNPGTVVEEKRRGMEPSPEDSVNEEVDLEELGSSVRVCIGREGILGLFRKGRGPPIVGSDVREGGLSPRGATSFKLVGDIVWMLEGAKK